MKATPYPISSPRSGTGHNVRVGPCMLLRLSLLLGLSFVSSGCLTPIPPRADRERVPEELRTVYAESSERYRASADDSLRAARQITDKTACRAYLTAAWDSYERAWERYSLGGDLHGMMEVASQIVSADVGACTEGLAEGISLFDAMMKEMQRTGLTAEEQSELTRMLRAAGTETPDSFGRLQQAFAAEMALWRFDGQEHAAESPARTRVLRLLGLAEESPLRDQVPLKWLQGSNKAVRDWLSRPK